VDECLRLSDDIAVLEGSTILQSDSAEAVYYRPQSKRIADLMGKNNLIPGIVRSKRFISPFGTFDAAGYDDGPYRLFLRPEQLTFCEDGGVGCVLKSFERTGKVFRLTLLADGFPLIVDTVSFQPPAAGAEYFLKPTGRELHLFTEGKHHA
jgi:ABC-type Fe3+/spermidine/putrescine transport system ATPase subunit